MRLPPLDQFSLQDTWWAARWRPAVVKACAQSRLTPAVVQAATTLVKTVTAASKTGGLPTARHVLPVERAHRRLLAALQVAGCPTRPRNALERHFRVYLRWWRQSGPTACALAVEKLLALAGAAETRLGPVFAGARRTRARDAAWYPELGRASGDSAAPRLYKGRTVTYDLTYRPERLRQVARVLIAKVRAGQPVHVRVLTGYLHRDAGPGRPPRTTHSLAVIGFAVLARRRGAPERVAFTFRDPDGGGQSTLVLDATRGTFGQEPAHPTWVNWEPYGWRYGAMDPPDYRYQVLSVR